MSVASLFGFGPLGEIEILFDGEDQRQMVEVNFGSEGEKRDLLPVFADGESICGKIIIRIKEGKRIEHSGIKVEFVGSIELKLERSQRNEFLSLVQELAVAGELKESTYYEYEFRHVEKQYESYYGQAVKLRYFIRVTIGRRLADMVRERDIWVYNYKAPGANSKQAMLNNKNPVVQNNPIKMEVGIEDCLHIEFGYNKLRYHLKDVIVGKICFLLVRIKIQYMEISIIRREIITAAGNSANESETVTKFEIMDGSPVRGETIPIRLFLSGFHVTPTFGDVNKKFSVRYYLSLALVDEENRRYFKQQEITLYRLPDNN